MIGTQQREAKEQRSYRRHVANDMEGLYPGAYWHPLNAIERPMEEPVNSKFFSVTSRGTIVPE